jgi:hypothetical protein
MLRGKFDRSKPSTFDRDDDLCPDSEKETWLHSWGDEDGDDITIKVRLTSQCTKSDIVHPIKELDTDWRAHRTAFTLHCTRIPVPPPSLYIIANLVGNSKIPQIHRSSIPDISTQCRPSFSPHIRPLGHTHRFRRKTSPLLIKSLCPSQTRHYRPNSLSYEQWCQRVCSHRQSQHSQATDRREKETYWRHDFGW